MRIITNIDSIIDSINHPIYGLKSSTNQKIDFLKYLNNGAVDKDNYINKDNNKTREDLYKEYGDISYEIKKDFFEKIYSDSNYYCPYCGKTLIIHWKDDDDKLIRSYDIEHFLPRSLFPDLSINLYNWLPACMSCNQRLKKSINPLNRINGDKGIFHPYFGFIKKDGKNKYYFDNNEDIFNNYSFIGNNGENILNSVHGKTFQLDNLYLHGEDTYKIFDFIYSKQSLIIDEYRKFNNTKTIDEYIEYFFNEYYPKDEFDVLKYDNGKFKFDLINDLRDILKLLLKS